MRRTINLIGMTAPFVVIVLLAWAIVETLSLINANLEYIGPKGQLPEDIYGFGFAGVWIALLLPFVGLCVLAHFSRVSKQRPYWIVLLAAYAMCTAVGFWLDHVIWPQLTR